MASPIARALMAAARLVEWGHRRIHGPKYRPGDVVEFTTGADGLRRGSIVSQSGMNIRIDCGKTEYGSVGQSKIIRVVRYAEENP